MAMDSQPRFAEADREDLLDSAKKPSYAALAALTNVPASTLWRRARGRPSKRDKAAKQQYLTPQEEKALVENVLRMSNNGYPLPVKFLRALALAIARQRHSVFQAPSSDDVIRPPGKNWPQGFYARHPELKARRVRALDWTRHDHHIHDKVTQWFSVIGPQLQDPAIIADNIYNMDETGVLLSVLHSLKVLVSRDDLKNFRGAGVKRTLVTAVECISAVGRHLPPLIIWPASTHRSTWTTHPTPGWHFACSKSGYTDNRISLYWIQNVFDPLTRPRAQGKPRVLINDGFATHESLELLKFCFENNIILCRLPSHTSHKLQPCDVGVFGPLKMAYREQVEKLYRGGANRTIERENSVLDVTRKHQLQKLANAAEKAFADRALLLDENRLLFEQNNEKTTRQSVKATVVGTAKVMSYEDIIKEQGKREAKVAKRPDQPQRGRKRKVAAAAVALNQPKRPRLEEREKASQEIEALGLREYCSVLQF